MALLPLVLAGCKLEDIPGLGPDPRAVARESEAKAIGIPVVWNLAGGYQSPHERIIEIHRNTMLACVAVYCRKTHA